MNLSRADKSFCRKWLKAFRKGEATAPLVKEWLSKLERPAPPKPKHDSARLYFEPSTVASYTGNHTIFQYEDGLRQMYALNALPTLFQPGIWR